MDKTSKADREELMSLLQIVYFECQNNSLVVSYVAKHFGFAQSALNWALKHANIIKNNGSPNHDAKWKWIPNEKPTEQLVDKLFYAFEARKKKLRNDFREKPKDSVPEFDELIIRLVKENNEMLRKLTAQEQIALKY